MVGVISLGRLRALGFDRGSCIFVVFAGLFAVRIAAHRLRKSGQEVIAQFQAIALALETKINKPQLSPLTNLRVGPVLCASGAHLNSELKALLVILEIEKRAEVRSDHVCADEHFERQVGHDTEFVPDEIRA